MPRGSKLHDGHRARMFDRFLAQGIDSFEEHEVLEILLYSIYKRSNTNEISHMLINKFGSIENVLKAPINELMTIRGVGRSVAAYIRFLGDFSKKYRGNARDRKIRFNSIELLSTYAKSLFTDPNAETAFAIFLDRSFYHVATERISDYKTDHSDLDIKQILRMAVVRNCNNLVIAHNHPGNAVGFSSADISQTKRLVDLLSECEITLSDHLIVSGDTVTSMRNSGVLNECWS